MTKQELMFPLIEAYEHEQGNLSIDAFCAARSIKVPTFHYWRRKFRAFRDAPNGFIPIPIPAPAACQNGRIRLAYPNGVSIELPAADMALIAQLIRLA